MDVVAKINAPKCELLLLRACAGISKLYFAMRTCSPRVFEQTQRSFDEALHSAMERIVTASGHGFGDWQLRLATLRVRKGLQTSVGHPDEKILEEGLYQVFGTYMEQRNQCEEYPKYSDRKESYRGLSERFVWTPSD
ncbi:hypothetical protein Tco_1376499 [Tanacetum coccineum]